MTREELDVFLNIMKSGSVTGAAKAMHLAQSTVSKRLRMLEEELGYRLVERAKGIRQLRLTREGKKFSEIAWRWMELYREARDLGKSQCVSIVVGTAPSTNMTFVPRLCTRMLSLEPDMHIRLVSLHSREMYGAVDRRVVDVGFSQAEVVHPDVKARPCFSVPMTGIRRRGGASRDTVPVQELDVGKYIHIPWGTRYETWYNYWFNSGGQSRLTVDNAYVLFTLLMREHSWSIVPVDIAHMLTASKNFETFCIQPAPPDRIFFKLTHKYPSPDAAMGIKVFDSCLAYVLHESPSEMYTNIQV